MSKRPTVTIVEGDLERPLRLQLLNGDGPQDLSGTTSRKLRLKSDEDGSVLFERDLVVDGDPVQGWLKYDWQAGETTPSERNIEVVITFADGKPATWPLLASDVWILKIRERRT